MNMQYSLVMTELKVAFWHALLTPFRDDELSQVPARGGNKMRTYIDKGAQENRRDTVRRPQGSRADFSALEPGVVKCDPSILVPGIDAVPGKRLSEKNGWYWLTKSDGGNEAMTKKSGSESIEDTVNDEKSQCTNGFRRAAQDAWGIGRFLHQEPLPLCVVPSNMPLVPGPVRIAEVDTKKFKQHAAVEQPQGEVSRSERDVPIQSAHIQEPTIQVLPPVLTSASETATPTAKMIQLPCEGHSVFDWAKSLSGSSTPAWWTV